MIMADRHGAAAAHGPVSGDQRSRIDFKSNRGIICDIDTGLSKVDLLRRPEQQAAHFAIR